MTPHIRWMVRADMPVVLEIEGRNVQPWTEEEFLRRLRQRNCIGMVAEWNGKVVGFMVYELEKFKLVLTNFAVHWRYRRRDVGRAMVEKLKSKLSSCRRTRICLAIRESNLRGQLFFRSQGFQAVGVERGWCEATGEDAYAMWYLLPDCEEYSGELCNRIAQYLEE